MGVEIIFISSLSLSWIIKIKSTHQISNPFLSFPSASLVAQSVKNPPAVWETWIRSLCWEDPLEKGKATHSSILAWRIPWIYSPWGCKELDTTEQLSLSLFLSLIWVWASKIINGRSSHKGDSFQNCIRTLVSELLWEGWPRNGGGVMAGHFFLSWSFKWSFYLFIFLVLPVYCYQPITLHPHAHMLSHVTPWTAATQAPLSMDFSRQEYWSGSPFPPP